MNPTFTPVRAGDEFKLVNTAYRYQKSLDLPSGPTRELAAFEYIVALEEALHGSAAA
jgi:hypothetical protein